MKSKKAYQVQAYSDHADDDFYDDCIFLTKKLADLRCKELQKEDDLEDGVLHFTVEILKFYK